MRLFGLETFEPATVPDFSKPPAVTAHQHGVQARVITARDIQMMGTTDARKLASRLRDKGIIGKTEYEANKNGAAKHARYFVSDEWLKRRAA